MGPSTILYPFYNGCTSFLRFIVDVLDNLYLINVVVCPIPVEVLAMP